MLPSAVCALSSHPTAHAPLSSLLSSHAWVPALNASLQSCPFTRVFVGIDIQTVLKTFVQDSDAISGFFQIFNFLVEPITISHLQVVQIKGRLSSTRGYVV